MSGFITAKELGNILRLSESTIYKLAHQGKIPAFKVGDSWRFDMEEIKVMVENAKRSASNSRKAS